MNFRSMQTSQNKEDCIRDRLVLGVRDKELSEKLQLKADLSLKEAITTARQYETVKHELSEQRDQAQPADLNRVQRNKPTSYNRPGSSSYSKTKSTTRSTSQHDGSQQRTKCGKCGKNHHCGKCPAFGKECHKCGRRNHFAKLCRSKTRARADQLEEELGYQEGTREVNVDNTEFFIDSITDTTLAPWRVDLKLEGSTVIDTGADVNVLSESSWKSLPLKPRLHPARNVHLSSPGGKLDIKGKFVSKINKQTATFYIVNNDVECLLSRDTSTALGLVKRLHNINAFSAVKCQPVKIKLKEGTTPYSLATSRRVPTPLQERVKKELQRMKDLDVIEDITEPTDWVSPMVPVVKKNGDIRICVDLKRLNKAVQRERYLIPSFEEIVHKLKGSTIFSKLDAQSGFWQIPLDPETAKLTTFISPFGRYFIKRLPFGISSAPEIFMRIVSGILKELTEWYATLTICSVTQNHQRTIKSS